MRRRRAPRQRSMNLADASPFAPMRKFLAYGGGVNTVAALAWLHLNSYTLDAIVMVDPGDEWPETEAYRDGPMREWLATVNFPPVTTITRIDEGKYNPRAWRLETLRQECMRIGSIPSIAYGYKKCSSKYKGDTSRWWAARQRWAVDEWVSGRKIAKIIGYDADESHRVRKAFQNPWEAMRMVPWYPLFDAGLTRDDCTDLIRLVGLPVPPKSSCTFCPSNTLAEWKLLRKSHPVRFEQAVEMSRNAAIESPDAIGLMRCNPHGKRQLHEWADGRYGDITDDAIDTNIPCDCAL